MFVSAAAAVSVYLFVSAPPPLAADSAQARRVPIGTVFALLERENDVARAMWTRDIVESGTRAGLLFDEHWRDDTIHAGPLPALFLRETARNLERTSLGLGLFLGSPYPINAANQLTGDQSKHFQALVQSGTPQFFTDATTGRSTAMFVDTAVTAACVSCHNQHADSPKTDWALGDVMGATTWMYPEETVTVERALELAGALRASIRQAYAAYLAKVTTFSKRPAIGTEWPRDGFALPSEDVFMRELARRSQVSALLALVDPAGGSIELDEAAPPPPTGVAKPTRTVTAPTRATTTTSAGATVGPATGTGTLVIRSARSTRVTVEHAGSRLLIARLAPGAVTTLTAPLPLRVQLSNPRSVEIEYGGTSIAIPPRDPGDRDKDVEVRIGDPVRVAEDSKRERS